MIQAPFSSQVYLPYVTGELCPFRAQVNFIFNVIIVFLSQFNVEKKFNSSKYAWIIM